MASRSNFLRLEVEVRLPGGERGAAVAGDGGREPPAEAVGGRSKSEPGSLKTVI